MDYNMNKEKMLALTQSVGSDRQEKINKFEHLVSKYEDAIDEIFDTVIQPIISKKLLRKKTIEAGDLYLHIGFKLCLPQKIADQLSWKSTILSILCLFGCKKDHVHHLGHDLRWPKLEAIIALRNIITKRYTTLGFCVSTTNSQRTIILSWTQ